MTSNHLALAVLLSCAAYAATPPHAAQAAGVEQTAMESKTFAVTGMTCGHCEKAISKKVSALKGVTFCKADHKAGTADVTFDPAVVDASAIAGAINSLGFTASAK